MDGDIVGIDLLHKMIGLVGYRESRCYRETRDASPRWLRARLEFPRCLIESGPAPAFGLISRRHSHPKRYETGRWGEFLLSGSNTKLRDREPG